MSTSLPEQERMLARLLESHIQYEMAQFDAPAFTLWARQTLDHVWPWLGTVSLGELVTAAQIKDDIRRNVVELDIPGAIAEIAGEASSALFTSPTHADTPLRDIMNADQFEEFVDKGLELKETRQRLIEHLVNLPVYTDLISGVLYQAIVRYIYDTNLISRSVPGVSSMLKMGRKVVSKTVPKLEGVVEDNVRAFIANNLQFLLLESQRFLDRELSDEQLKISAMDVWDSLENRTLGDLQAGINPIDLSEFVVLGYEFWQEFRKSAYFQQSYELIVDYLFDKYGEEPLSVLLDDMTLNPDRIMIEVEHFAPRILSALRQSGQLEAIVRRRLAGFYQSTEALDSLTLSES